MQMGYNISRLTMDDDEPSNHAQPSLNQPSSYMVREMFELDNEIFHITMLKSKPSEGLCQATRSMESNMSTFRMLSGREINSGKNGGFSKADRSCVLGGCLAVNGPHKIDKGSTRAYVSRFSDDGSLLVTAFQGGHIRIYDVEQDWKVHKDILARSMRWTITDTSLSPDQRYLVYSSMSPIVNLVNIDSAATESHANITVAMMIPYVYDLHANKVSLRLEAHTADVNTVAFADETSHLIFSGSDDSLCKVWDRRCLNQGQVAGVLTGHLEGVTCIDSRGDGRYFISNGKDQTLKLWDIRKMSSNMDRSRIRYSNWDYRYTPYPQQYEFHRHPYDQSLATYRGHAVLRTLIRCYFSPEYSTGKRYIYTGSHDSCVYIYDLVTGAEVAKLDCEISTAVRDCSWHPYYPTLVNCTWDGQVVRWEYIGNSYEDKMEWK
ncbi:Guanine nucleotide-binding protein G(I)/G(S)/G(T) subunit beta-1 [Rhynchospora pubera]|uniref:Guanine nucleotide-binding protein G(I)/G(S)/G(T) subunit beta-1 n=1 Tax=Rhynchospora pubera TaxID=906938 RepID=A0AAV8F5U1_9POAL|nr:Guanine nucleotide-binding protein G(I)/G(S)/G(T) subunit beta-1 [Rhynchospora pubera]